MNKTIEAAWVEPGGLIAKFYHTSDACKLQLDESCLVTGTEIEARRKGIVPCPDCEKANGSSR